ncbi:MAG TPA: amidohydrolase [Candidatus Binatia bacterium]
MKRSGVILLLFALAGCGGGAEVDFARSLAVKAPADLVLRGGKIVTVDRDFSIRQAVAIRDGHFVAVGTDRDMRPLTGPSTRVVDLAGRTVIPGLIDSHIHATVACSRWDSELHWEMVRTLADGLRQIAAAARSQPPGSWIVVGGGWVPTQFSERRFPSRAELDTIAPNHPVYIQYLGQGALLNSAGLAAAGIAPGVPDPPGGKFERNPSTQEFTGWLQGAAAWEYVYRKLSEPPLDKIRDSLRNCFHELSRLGVTSIADVHASGVTFAHRRVLSDMARSGELPLRINFYLAPDEGGDALAQLKNLAEEIKHLPQNDRFRFSGFDVGLGDDDMLVVPKGGSLTPAAKEQFRAMARFFAAAEYSFQLRSTYDGNARQLLDVLEQVNAEKPFSPRRITFAHMEGVTPETIARIKKLGAGITVQDRMVLTGERNVELWGLPKARNAPPLRAIIESGIPVGAGTDAFRSGNYSPMLALWWLVTGKTVAGTALRERSQNLSRKEALRLFTVGSAWFTFDEGRKGSIEVGKVADLAILNADYLTVPEDQIRTLQSLSTMVGGRIVYTAGPFANLERK